MKRDRFLQALLVVIVDVAAPGDALSLDPRKAITQYVHDAWRVEQGLPQASVLSLVQTRDGYVWFGTESGLVRFDGVRFTVFDRRSTPALARDHVRFLLEDRDGSLWIVSAGGGLTRLRNDTFTELTKADGLTTEKVNVLLEDRSGVLWIGTAGGGLNRSKDGAITAFTTKDGLASDRVRALAEDREGSLWIGTSGGLTRLRDGTFTTWTRRDGLAHDVVNALALDREANLWIGTDGGLSRLRDGRFTTFTTKDGLARDEVTCVLEDREGTLWIGADEGLTRLREGRFDASDLDGLLPDDAIMSLLLDREGSLWLGTAGDGLHRLRDGKFTPYTADEGLADSLVYAILEGRDGSLWFGTEDGLTRLKDGAFTSFTTKDGLSSNEIGALAEGRDGSLWIGTAGGLDRLKDGRFTRVGGKEGVSGHVRALLEDREARLWIGTEGGLSRLRGGELTRFTTKDGLSGNLVTSLLEDREGSLWAGTGRGLNRLRDGRFTLFTTKEGLPNDGIPDAGLLEDQDGALWIATFGGLARFRDGKLTSLVMPEGPFDEMLWRLLEDDQGNLWTASNRGIYRIDKRELDAHAEGKPGKVSWILFDANDGLPIAEGTCCGRLKTRDGRLWFPTTKGVAVVDPARIATNPVPPPVLVEEVRVDGTLAARPATGAPLPLAPGTAKLEIRYTAPSFVVPKRVRFRYRLEGFDAGWVDAGTDRVAHYTNLPPRAYTFRVIACNDDGLWNETGASLALALLPRFFQTWWFLGLEGMAGLGLLAGTLVLQRRRLDRRRDREVADERREADLSRKTEELEQARRVQLALLPKEPLTVGTLTVAGRMQTATEVGGDYYGYLETGGRLCVVIGDATGHGMAAGLVAGMLKSALAALSKTRASSLGPSRWLADLNNALRTSISQRGLGVCAGIGLADTGSGGVELGMAGVPNPFVVSASGAIERLPLSGTPLGYLKRLLTATTTLTLAPGARLVLITDGLIEQTDAAGEEWGYAGVEAALATIASPDASAEEVAEALLAACERFGAGQPRTDDRTVLVLARRAAA